MNDNFPRLLSLLRSERGISQKEVSGKLGVSQAVLSHYENGAREPGLDFVVKAADYYSVSADFLLGRTMSRDDHAISLGDLEKASETEDNVLKGSVLLTLNKRLIMASISLIFDILSKSAGSEVISNISDYFKITIYKVFRFLYGVNTKNMEGFFKTPDYSWENISDAQLKVCEAKYKDLMVRPEEREKIPEMTNEYLSKNHSTMLSALLNVLHSVSKMFEK